MQLAPLSNERSVTHAESKHPAYSQARTTRVSARVFPPRDTFEARNSRGSCPHPSIREEEDSTT